MEEEHPEEDALQALADDEDDDEEMTNYRLEAFGAGAESDDSDHEEITAPAGKKQRTACFNRVINTLTANCAALEKSIAVKDAEMMNAGIEASTLECRGSTGCFPVAETCIQVLADEEAPNQRKVQAMLSVAIASVSANKILKDLIRRKEFQMKNVKIKHEGLLKQAYGLDCGEVYSPPRIKKIASEMGLHLAWALDLTVMDSYDGNPCDFNMPAKRQRAIELLEKDKPQC